MREDIRKIRGFWLEVPFFGTRVEQFVAERWYVILLLPFLYWVALGVWTGRQSLFLNATSFLRSPYILSLGAALYLAAAAFSFWQSTVRKTFSTVVESGIISDSPESIKALIAASSRFEAMMRSRFRFIPIAAVFLSTLIVNGRFGGLDQTQPAKAFGAFMANVFILLGAYAVGAGAWSLLSAARWIAMLSHDDMLSIQPGHSDGCCGLKGIGDCCLQSAVPLLIGMVLCLAWINGPHLRFFQSSKEFGQWDVIVFFSYAMMATLFVLACTLVFLPVRGLHDRLVAYKRTRDLEFTKALSTETARIRETLTSADDNGVVRISGRLKIIHALDPENLRLAG